MTEEASPFQFRAWKVIDLAAMPSRTDEDVCGISDEDDGYLTLRWGGGPYDLDIRFIERPEDLLWAINHLTRKAWKEMTPNRIGALIDIVAVKRGWKPFEPVSHPNEAPAPNHDKIAEREKMTPAIRYAVIKRDAYRCRCCGFAVQDGAHLHVDHIVAVANGGRTELKNLQTLCTVCNIGKAAK